MLLQDGYFVFGKCLQPCFFQRMDQKLPQSGCDTHYMPDTYWHPHRCGEMYIGETSHSTRTRMTKQHWQKQHGPWPSHWVQRHPHPIQKNLAHENRSQQRTKCIPTWTKWTGFLKQIMVALPPFSERKVAVGIQEQRSLHLPSQHHLTSIQIPHG